MPAGPRVANSEPSIGRLMIFDAQPWTSNDAGCQGYVGFGSNCRSHTLHRSGWTTGRAHVEPGCSVESSGWIAEGAR
jgi:hypothetical protein